MNMKAEWKRASAFAEHAEALGIDTKDVLAAWSVIENDEPTGVVAVLYGTDAIYEARLVRGPDDIFIVVGRPELTDLRIEDLFRDRA